MKPLERLLTVLAPHVCMKCGTEGDVLCATCLPAVPVPIPSRCYRCMALSPYGATCRSCRSTSCLQHVWVASEYEESIKELIHALKFQRQRAAASICARLMSGTLPYLPADTVITYAPTASSRVRVRGYDQAERIAKELAWLVKRPYSPLLIRESSARQLGASRVQRLSQAKNAFRCKNLPVIQEADHIVVVDDVLTTGATLEAAAYALKSQGAKRISAAVCAQVKPS